MIVGDQLFRLWSCKFYIIILCFVFLLTFLLISDYVIVTRVNGDHDEYFTVVVILSIQGIVFTRTHNLVATRCYSV